MQAGELALGRYRLGASIGKGAMGEVYRAVDERTGKAVAVKRVTIDPDDEQADMLRGWFSRELKALKVLDHPNVLRLVDHGDEQGYPIVVTELLEGMDLRAVLDVAGALDSETTAAIGACVCSALQLAHSLSIVHRDIKPANLFLCRNGRVVLLDFGLARATLAGSDHTLAQSYGTQIVGTPYYLSPEQIAGGPANISSDVYSTAGTLYTLAANALPYTGKTAIAVLQAIVRGSRKPLLEVAPHVKPDVASVVEDMFAPTVETRLTADVAAKRFAACLREPPEAVLAAFAGRVFMQVPTDASRTASLRVSMSDDSDTERDALAARDDQHSSAQTVVQSAATSGARGSSQTVIQTALVAPRRDHHAAESQAPLVSESGTFPHRTPGSRARTAGAALIALAAVAAAAAVVWSGRTHTPETEPTLQRGPDIPASLPVGAQPASRDELPAPTALPPADVPQVETPVERVEPRPAAAPSNGTLELILAQWAEVIVDGRSIGKKQIATRIELKTGPHSVEFVNPKYPSKRLNVSIRRSQTTSLHVNLAE